MDSGNESRSTSLPLHDDLSNEAAEKSPVSTQNYHPSQHSRSIFRRIHPSEKDETYQDAHVHSDRGLRYHASDHAASDSRHSPPMQTPESMNRSAYHPRFTNRQSHAYSYIYGMTPPPPYPQYVEYGTHHPPPGYHPYYGWEPPPATLAEPIADIQPHDVLSGRGGATNSHSGNRAFRSLVKKHQNQYLAAKKRDKPAVAAIIVEKIRDKGGRFLKKFGTTPDGQVLWMEIGDERAKEKTAQALREGAPELRRKRKASTDEEDSKRPDEVNANLSRDSSFGRSISNDDSSRSVSQRTFIKQNSADSTTDVRHQSASIMIQPSATLLQNRIPQAIAVDQLTPGEREIYLRDFLPPDPGIRKRMGNGTFLDPSTPCPESSDGRQDQSNPWPIVKV